MSPVSYLYIVASLGSCWISCGSLAGRWSATILIHARPTFAACYPNLVWPVDIADTRGRIALFDRMIADN
jgi:hypothetical protein